MWQQPQRPGFVPPEWLQAGYYQNIPHGEVNWAQLAQQWIAMRQVEEQEFMQRRMQQQLIQQQQQQHQIQQQQLQQHLQQQQEMQQFLYRMNMPYPQQMAVGQQFPHGTQDATMAMRFQQPTSHPQQPMVHHQSTVHQQSTPHPPVYPPPMQPSEPQALFPSGQAPPTPRVSRPLLATPDRSRFTKNPPEKQPKFTPLPTPISAPSLLTTDFQPPPGYVPPSAAEPTTTSVGTQDVDFRNMWPTGGRTSREESPVMDDEQSMIDMQMRKQLPAWIREGLEKMEREKRKQQEQFEQEAKDKAEANSEGGGRVPKWRLEDTEEASDSEQNRTDSKVADTSKDLSEDGGGSRSEVEEDVQSSSSEDADEFRDQLLLKLRYWMTSILLDVTSSEISNVVRTFYKSSRESDEDERNEADSSSDAEEKETVNSWTREDNGQFKIPILPPSSSTMQVSVSKKYSASADDAVNDALKSNTQDMDQKTGFTELRKSSPSTNPSSKATEKKEMKKSDDKSSSKRDSGEKPRHEHRHRSRSPASSRSKRSRERSRSSDRKRSHRSSRHQRRSRSRSNEKSRRDSKEKSKEKDRSSHSGSSDKHRKH